MKNDVSQPATKKDLFEFRDGIRDDIKVATQDIVAHFNASQVAQNERMDKMDGRFDKIEGRLDRIDDKLDDIGDDVAKVKLAVVDLMGTEKALHNLVDELHRNGIAVDKQKVFAR